MQSTLRARRCLRPCTMGAGPRWTGLAPCETGRTFPTCDAVRKQRGWAWTSRSAVWLEPRQVSARFRVATRVGHCTALLRSKGGLTVGSCEGSKRAGATGRRAVSGKARVASSLDVQACDKAPFARCGTAGAAGSSHQESGRHVRRSSRRSAASRRRRCSLSPPCRK